MQQMSKSVQAPRGRLIRRPLWACLFALGTTTAVAEAQDNPAPTSSSAVKTSKKTVTLGAMTVTATKRKTSIDKTPIAITAIPAETLSDAGALDVKDYAKLVPGLSVQDNGPGATRLSIRGIYSTGEATTGVYYDETPISGSVGSTNDAGGRSPDLSLFDVDRIEVLRGPQGTLYGASSMGGAIRVIYEKPKLDTYEGAVEAGYAITKGGDQSWLTHAMVNLPLVQDKLAARVVVYKRDTGGYVDNTYLHQSNVNDAKTSGGRLLLRYKPTDKVTVDASYADESSNATNAGWSPLKDVRYGSVAQLLVPYRDLTRISNITLNWDLDWATLTAVTSYFDRTSAYGLDSSYLFEKYLSYGAASAAQYIPASIYYPGATNNWSNELRLSSRDNDTLEWTVGLYNENRKNRLFSEDVMADPASGRFIKPLDIFYRRHINDNLKQKAVYGETTWHATSRLNITTGLRYYQYDKTIVGYTDIPLALIGAPKTAPSTVKAGESGWLKKLNISYEVAPTTMLYATAADGMRPGGANQVIGLAENLTAYNSDSLWNYEIGAKTRWLDDKLYLNVALYQINWHNMQVNAQTANGAYQFLTNAGSARMRGTEWELMYRPMPGLDLSANFNYIDPKLVQDQINNNIAASNTLGRDGDRVPYIAKWTGDLAVAYRWPLSDDYDGMVRVDANYVGTSYSTFRPTDPARIAMGNYTMTNARFGVESADGKWSGYLYVNNLFNKLATTSATVNPYFFPYGLAYSVPPRTIGVDLKYNFF